MPDFHRLTVPTYYGGLPVGFDYINNAISGTPANANGVLSGGPNTGSYFVGFGDDATSANANRPNLALATNTDYLDNLFRRDLALPVVSGTAAGGPGAVNIVLPVNTFLGVAGTTNDPTGLKPYFHITDDSDNDITDPAGVPVVVSSLTLTGPDVIGVGFSQNTVTAVFSEAIPTGRNYRVYYAMRGNLATLPQDAFTVIRIRGTQEVPAETEELFRLLHGNSQAWDDPWTSTIWDLSLSGLDERYNRATTADGSVPASWPFAIANNSAGSGGWYRRTGPGITGFSNKVFTGTHGYTGDTIGWMAGALFASLNQDDGVDPTGVFTGPTRVGGETTGFYYLGHQRFTTVAQENLNGNVPGFSSFFYGSAIEQIGTPYTNLKTWIPIGSTVTFTSDVDVTIGGGGWAALAGSPTPTAIAIGYDLLEVDFGDSIKRQFVITAINSTTSIKLANKDGSTLEGTGLTATVVRWIRAIMGGFENAPVYRNALVAGSPTVLHRGFLSVCPPQMSIVGGENVNPYPAGSFFGQDITGSTVLQWGGYRPSSFTYVSLGVLSSDGGAQFNGLVQASKNGLSLQATGQVAAASYHGGCTTTTGAASPASLDLSTSSSANIVTPAGAGALTVNVTNVNASTEEFFIVVKQTAANFSTIVVTCDSGVTVHFETGTLDATLGGANSTDVYRGLVVGTNCFMSVQRFPGV